MLIEIFRQIFNFLSERFVAISSLEGLLVDFLRLFFIIIPEHSVAFRTISRPSKSILSAASFTATNTLAAPKVTYARRSRFP